MKCGSRIGRRELKDRDDFRKTSEFVQRLVTSMGSQGEFCQHGLGGPPSVVSSVYELFRFDGGFTAHIYEVSRYTMEQRCNLPGGTRRTDVIVHKSQNWWEGDDDFHEFVMRIMGNRLGKDDTTTRTNVDIWGPFSKDQQTGGNGDPTVGQASEERLVSEQREVDDTIEEHEWPGRITLHYLEDAPGWPFGGRVQE